MVRYAVEEITTGMIQSLHPVAVLAIFRVGPEHVIDLTDAGSPLVESPELGGVLVLAHLCIYLMHSVSRIAEMPGDVPVHKGPYDRLDLGISAAEDVHQLLAVEDRIIRQLLESNLPAHSIATGKVADQVVLITGVVEFLVEGGQVITESQLRFHLGDRCDDFFKDEILVELRAWEESSAGNSAQAVQPTQEVGEVTRAGEAAKVLLFDPAALEEIQRTAENRHATETAIEAEETGQVCVHTLPEGMFLRPSLDEILAKGGHLLGGYLARIVQHDDVDKVDGYADHDVERALCPAIHGHQRAGPHDRL